METTKNLVKGNFPQDIILPNRYGVKNASHLELIEENEYKLITPFPYRKGLMEDNEGTDFIDPDGGPFMTRGYKIQGTNLEVEDFKVEENRDIICLKLIEE